MKNQSSNVKRVLRVYWQHAKPFKRQLLIIYPAMICAQIIEDFLQPLVVSYILTRLAAGTIDELSTQTFALIVGGILVTEITSHLLWNKVIIRRFWRTQDKIMAQLYMTAFNHLQTMSMRFFDNRFAGSLVNQVNKFVGSFERLTDALTWNVFKLIVSVIATTVILAPNAPLVSVAILIIGSIYVPVLWRYRKAQLAFNKAWAAAETERTGQLADAISNIAAVKSFAAESTEQKRMQQKVNKVHKKSLDTMQINMDQELVTGGIQRSINVVVIVISVLLATRGNVEVGIVYLALTFTIAIMRRLWDLNNTFRTFTRVFGDANDMAEILEIKPEVSDVANAPDIVVNRGTIAFNNVRFVYPGEQASSALFDKLKIHIKPGEKIGLVGHSGGGKTSITKLLQRVLDINGGSITIDNQDISKVSQSSLRKVIASVPQEPLLFHRTITENIAYGRQNASTREIKEVAKMAHADEFIKELPDGYDTIVGERGVKLSGGQRQRIAIARALLKNAPILVLDEATSALDSESEVLIQDALWKLMQNRTAIVIAHRLSTIQKMDRILVMDKGSVVEEGTHNELVRKNGIYADLWNHQSGGFIEE